MSVWNGKFDFGMACIDFTVYVPHRDETCPRTYGASIVTSLSKHSVGTFALCRKHHWGLNYPTRKQWWLSSYWSNVQADLTLLVSHFWRKDFSCPCSSRINVVVKDAIVLGMLKAKMNTTVYSRRFTYCLHRNVETNRYICLSENLYLYNNSFLRKQNWKLKYSCITDIPNTDIASDVEWQVTNLLNFGISRCVTSNK